nr:hypothetical protein CFP56_28775 [Quercus suber]
MLVSAGWRATPAAQWGALREDASRKEYGCLQSAERSLNRGLNSTETCMCIRSCRLGEGSSIRASRQGSGRAHSSDVVPKIATLAALRGGPICLGRCWPRQEWRVLAEVAEMLRRCFETYSSTIMTGCVQRRGKDHQIRAFRGTVPLTTSGRVPQSGERPGGSGS